MQVQDECNKAASMSLFNTSLAEHVSLEEFEGIQTQTFTEVRGAIGPLGSISHDASVHELGHASVKWPHRAAEPLFPLPFLMQIAVLIGNYRFPICFYFPIPSAAKHKSSDFS